MPSKKSTFNNSSLMFICLYHPTNFVWFIHSCRDTSDSEIENVHGCFDFRLRTRSFDLHQIAQNQKIKKLSNLLRHNSVTSVKVPLKDSLPKASKSSRGSTPVPPAHRRRLVRVIRDAQCPDMENPFVVHKFSPEFFEQSNIERRSGSFSSGDKSTVLPYSVTGHTILKRQASECCDSDSLPQTPSPSVQKHASFQTDVIVIEFDKKSKVQKAKAFHSTHLEKLNDSYEFGCYNSNESHEDQLRFNDDYEKAVSKDSSGDTSPESTSDSDSIFKSEAESKESSTDVSNVKIESNYVTTLSDVKTNANSVQSLIPPCRM